MKINPNDLIAISGQPLSYPQLCKALNIPVKSGNSRAAFFDRLKLCCDVKKTGKKYIISNVQKDSPFFDIHANNKFQVFVDQLILEALQRENGRPLHLSRREIIQELGLVNQNYKYVKNNDNIRLLGESRSFLYDSVPKVTSLLFTWVRRRLESMNKRNIILYTDGFAALRRMMIDNKEVIVRENFQYNSEKEKMALKTYQDARKATLPEELQESAWIPPEYMTRFREELERETRYVFGPEYITIFQTVIIRSTKAIVESTIKNCKKILNDESIRKISETRQLNQLTGFQREKLLDEVIALNPQVNYDLIISQNEKEQWERYKQMQEERRKIKKGINSPSFQCSLSMFTFILAQPT